MFSSLFGCMSAQPQKIARNEIPDLFGRQGLIISTIGDMGDTEHSYETAVSHPEYNDGRWVIVQEYDTEEDARNGHEKWLKTMTADALPNELRDVSTAGVAQMAEEVGGNTWRRMPRIIDVTPPDQNLLPEGG